MYIVSVIADGRHHVRQDM